MVKFGIAFGIFLLRSVIISATEECDDSAYLQRQQSQPMTPVAPAYTFMEVGAKGSVEEAPSDLTCGRDGMYPFGGTGVVPNKCLTVTENTPAATRCTFADFNHQASESTCWYPFQEGTDYCEDVFAKDATTQVTLEGTDVPQTEETQGGKHACFTAMPVQFCPKYVCVVAGVPEMMEPTNADEKIEQYTINYKRACYDTGGKTCRIETANEVDKVVCTEWNPTDGSTFCLSSMARMKDDDDTSPIAPINVFAIQWECCQSGGSSGDPHVRTMDGKHYTLLQEGTFKLWSFSNVTTEYRSSQPDQLIQQEAQLKQAKVDWEIFVHYSTGRSFAKGLLLVDKTLDTHQFLELTSESCRWRTRSGTGEWMNVDRPMPLFTPEGSDFVTGFNLSATGRKNGKMDVRFLMNTRHGIKRIASLKISCQPGHHINTKLRLDKMHYKKAVAGQISAGRQGIVPDRSTDSNISQALTEMRRMSGLQMMQDQEFFVDTKWVDVGGSSNAAAYLKLVDDDSMKDARTYLATCNEEEEKSAKKTCAKYMGSDIENSSGSRRDAFADCVFDVCAGGGEAAAELAAEIMTEGDY